MFIFSLSRFVCKTLLANHDHKLLSLSLDKHLQSLVRNAAVRETVLLSAHERQVTLPAAHSAAEIQQARVLTPPEPQRVLQL